jgi:hypothetical protein
MRSTKQPFIKRHCEERSNPRLCRGELAWLFIFLMVSLIAAKAYFFCLDTKETKNQVSRNASLPHEGHCAANQAKPGLGTLALLTLSHVAITLLQKSRYALPLHKATIVLPDFTRSCSTDGERSLTQTLSKGEGLKKELMNCD